MKNYKRIKRFGAAATAIAMLGTLSVGVFADEADVVEETVPEVVAEEVTDETVLPEVVKEVIEAPVAVEDEAEALEVDSATGDVKDSDNLLGDTQLDITAVTATKQLIADTTDQYNYTVTLSYAFDSDKVSDVTGKQVAMVGYTYDKGGDQTAAASKEFGAAEVFAIDQAGASATGTFVVKLTSKSDAPKKVENSATLILKIGSDALANGGAQAVAIDLAGAKEQNAFTATKAVANPAEVSVPYGSTGAEAIAALSGVTATVSNDDNSNSATGYTVSDWAIKSGTTFDGAAGAENTFVGKVVRDAEDSITFASELTVEVKVTISSLTDGTLTVETDTVKVGTTTIPTKEELVKSIKISNSKLSEPYEVLGSGLQIGYDKNVWTKELDTSAVGNEGTFTVEVWGQSNDGKFNIPDTAKLTATATVKVVDAVTIVYGDISGPDGKPDGKINSRDLMALERAAAEWEGYEKYRDLNESPGADVFKDGKINSRDLMVLERAVAEWEGYFGVLPLTKMP